MAPAALPQSRELGDELCDEDRPRDGGEYALEWGLEDIRDHDYSLAARLRARLRELPRVEVLDLGRAPCGIVTFSIAGADARAVARKLSEQRINVSVSTIEDTRLDKEARGRESWVRASVHYFNTEEDIIALADAIEQMVEARAGGSSTSSATRRVS